MIISFFDGACEPKNPGGSMGIGSIIFKATNPEIIPLNGTVFFKREENWETVFEHCECIHPGERGFQMTSNNVAEYIAFTKVVEYLISNDITETVYILGDSKLVVEQMVGSWRMKGGIYIKFAKKAQDLYFQLKHKNLNVYLYWISRDNNIADEVSKRNMKKRGVQFKIQPE